MSEIYASGVGIAFQATLMNGDNPLNVSGALITQFLLKKPTNILLIKNASLLNSGTDGKLQYLTASGDLDTVGIWRWQCFVQLGSSGFYSDISTFKVHPNL